MDNEADTAHANRSAKKLQEAGITVNAAAGNADRAAMATYLRPDPDLGHWMSLRPTSVVAVTCRERAHPQCLHGSREGYWLPAFARHEWREGRLLTCPPAPMSKVDVDSPPRRHAAALKDKYPMALGKICLARQHDLPEEASRTCTTCTPRASSLSTNNVSVGSSS